MPSWPMPRTGLPAAPAPLPRSSATTLRTSKAVSPTAPPRWASKINEHIAKAEEQLVTRANVIADTFTAVGQHIGQSTNDAARAIATSTRELNALMAERSAEISKHPRRDRASARRHACRRKPAAGADARSCLRNAPPKSCAPRTPLWSTHLPTARRRRCRRWTAPAATCSDGVADLIARLSASSTKLGELIASACRQPVERRHDADHHAPATSPLRRKRRR